MAPSKQPSTSLSDFCKRPFSRLGSRDTIDAILQHHRIRKFKKFVIETNQFQNFPASETEADQRTGGGAATRA